MYIRGIRLVGWFWRVTVGGGDRTQWPENGVCMRVRAYANGLCRSPKSVFSDEESVGNRVRNYSHTPPSSSPACHSHPLPPPRFAYVVCVCNYYKHGRLNLTYIPYTYLGLYMTRTCVLYL